MNATGSAMPPPEFETTPTITAEASKTLHGLHDLLATMENEPKADHPRHPVLPSSTATPVPVLRENNTTKTQVLDTKLNTSTTQSEVVVAGATPQWQVASDIEAQFAEKVSQNTSANH